MPPRFLSSFEEKNGEAPYTVHYLIKLGLLNPHPKNNREKFEGHVDRSGELTRIYSNRRITAETNWKNVHNFVRLTTILVLFSSSCLVTKCLKLETIQREREIDEPVDRLKAARSMSVDYPTHCYVLIRPITSLEPVFSCILDFVVNRMKKKMLVE